MLKDRENSWYFYYNKVYQMFENMDFIHGLYMILMYNMKKFLWAVSEESQAMDGCPRLILKSSSFGGGQLNELLILKVLCFSLFLWSKLNSDIAQLFSLKTVAFQQEVVNIPKVGV